MAGTPIKIAPSITARPSRFRRALRVAERLLAVIGLGFILYHAAFEVIVMTSDSMAPTLQGTTFQNGDRILLEKVSGRVRSPRRWEISYFHNEDEIPVAKRVVGQPGERISIRNRQIFINGVALERPGKLKSLEYLGYGNLANNREVDCEQGYFMLGDASIDSYDSRFTGVVNRNAFQGRVWCVLWPLSHAGFVR